MIDGHFPAGTSVYTPAHFAQLYNNRNITNYYTNMQHHFTDIGIFSGESFQKYNYGRRQNLLTYGQSTPPSYDLSQVTCPVHIFWGKNDKAVAPEVGICSNKSTVLFLSIAQSIERRE